MRIASFRPCRLCKCSGSAGVRAFTLIELLTVVAIIALLIGILVPSLGSARDSAKKVKGKAAMKSIGEGLEAFASELPKELKGQNYPDSKAGDDPTDSGNDALADRIFGAQWAVRYLLGKDFKGYIPPTQVAKQYFDAAPGFAQKGWYVDSGDPNSVISDANISLPRAGPYLSPEAVAVKKLADVASSPPSDPTKALYAAPVFVDAFDMPILYYSANSKHANSAKPNPVTTQIRYPNQTEGYAGIFNFGDNAIFTTGRTCSASLCIDIAATAVVPLSDDGSPGPLYWGPTDIITQPPSVDDGGWKPIVDANPNAFVSYVLDKSAYEASGEQSVVPVRRDSFIMVSPGKDGKFGTKDDIKNWE